MFTHKKTGIKFKNRKQAVVLLGQTRYRKLLKYREFEFADLEDTNNKNKNT